MTGTATARNWPACKRRALTNKHVEQRSCTAPCTGQATKLAPLRGDDLRAAFAKFRESSIQAPNLISGVACATVFRIAANAAER
ncbi:hypothetical protein AQ611_19845 [Burkholderia singularis]|nr:hypothetical protein AQ611_19845 [Burkholderia sp. Bp7605]